VTDPKVSRFMKLPDGPIPGHVAAGILGHRKRSGCRGNVGTIITAGLAARFALAVDSGQRAQMRCWSWGTPVAVPLSPSSADSGRDRAATPWRLDGGAASCWRRSLAGSYGPAIGSTPGGALHLAR